MKKVLLFILIPIVLFIAFGAYVFIHFGLSFSMFSTKENKELARDLVSVLETKDAAKIAELISKDAIDSGLIKMEEIEELANYFEGNASSPKIYGNSKSYKENSSMFEVRVGFNLKTSTTSFKIAAIRIIGDERGEDYNGIIGIHIWKTGREENYEIYSESIRVEAGIHFDHYYMFQSLS